MTVNGYEFTANVFTFHYASTLSHVRIKGSRSHALFTFHYASTLSFGRKSHAGEVRKIYIPLCFYFIALKTLLVAFFLTFTFHYASTLSRDRP